MIVCRAASCLAAAELNSASQARELAVLRLLSIGCPTKEVAARDGSVLVLTISPKICFDPLFAIRRLPHGDLEIIEQLANFTNGYGHCHGVRFQTSIAYATKPVIHFAQLTS